MIHQELQQVPELTVAQNMFLGRSLRRGGVFRRSRGAGERRRPRRSRRSTPPSVPTRRSRSLKVAQRQIVEIGRALLENARIIAMDEPTSSLTPSEFERLAEVIADLAARGRLDHLCLAQDGRSVQSLQPRDHHARRATGRRGQPRETTESAVVAMMVGRELAVAQHHSSATSEDRPVGATS